MTFLQYCYCCSILIFEQLKLGDTIISCIVLKPKQLISKRDFLCTYNVLRINRFLKVSMWILSHIEPASRLFYGTTYFVFVSTHIFLKITEAKRKAVSFLFVSWSVSHSGSGLSSRLVLPLMQKVGSSVRYRTASLTASQVCLLWAVLATRRYGLRHRCVRAWRRSKAV